MNNERPDWSTEKTFLSLRDIGRLLLAELKEALDRWDTNACNAINTPDDE